MSNLYKKLLDAKKRYALPTVIAYNRIDGPGSSLDLREFQQTFWTLKPMPHDFYSDPSMKWTEKFPVWNLPYNNLIYWYPTHDTFHATQIRNMGIKKYKDFQF